MLNCCSDELLIMPLIVFAVVVIVVIESIGQAVLSLAYSLVGSVDVDNGVVVPS